MSCTRAWLISTCGISEVPSGTSCTRATRGQGSLRAGRPEGGLVDPDRLALDLLGKAEGLEHFHRAHADAVGLALFHRRRAWARPASCGSAAPGPAGRPGTGPPAPSRRSARPPCRGSGSPARRWPGAAGWTSGSPGLKPSRWYCMVSPSGSSVAIQVSLHMICIHTKIVKRIGAADERGDGSGRKARMDRIEMAGHLIRRLHQQSTQVFQARTQAAGFDLTSVQFAALDAIAQQPGIDQASLAATISFDRATIGGVIDRLEQKGLVQRVVSAQDRRARQLQLTPEGEQAAEGQPPGGASLAGRDPGAAVRRGARRLPGAGAQGARPGLSASRERPSRLRWRARQPHGRCAWAGAGSRCGHGVRVVAASGGHQPLEAAVTVAGGTVQHADGVVFGLHTQVRSKRQKPSFDSCTFGRELVLGRQLAQHQKGERAGRQTPQRVSRQSDHRRLAPAPTSAAHRWRWPRPECACCNAMGS